MEFIAKTLFGLEELVANELNELGAEEVQILKRAVAFKGDLRTMYKANLHSRYAMRILRLEYSFKAKDERELYEKVKELPWEEHLTSGETFAISATTFSEAFQHSKYASLKMKDALVDRLRQQSGSRPDVDTQNPDLQLNLHISQDQVNISLDSSGGTLNRRGYRASGHFAPLNEVLAAAMIKLSEWDPEQTFYDPMCGSGTLCIEAAMLATNMAPGLHREEFGFMNWKDYDAELWKEVKSEAEAAVNLEVELDIRGSEIKGLYGRMAKSAAEQVGLGEHIRFFQGDFFEQSLKNATLMMNPPYGERLGHRDIEDFYADMGDRMKSSFEGCSVWLLSANMDAMKNVGLRPSRRIRLFNGQLECQFQRFDMYSGTKRVHKLEEDYVKPGRAEGDDGPRTDRDHEFGERRTDSKFQKRAWSERPNAENDRGRREGRRDDNRRNDRGPRRDDHRGGRNSYQDNRDRRDSDRSSGGGGKSFLDRVKRGGEGDKPRTERRDDRGPRRDDRRDEKRSWNPNRGQNQDRARAPQRGDRDRRNQGRDGQRPGYEERPRPQEHHKSDYDGGDTRRPIKKDREGSAERNERSRDERTAYDQKKTRPRIKKDKRRPENREAKGEGNTDSPSSGEEQS